MRPVDRNSPLPLWAQVEADLRVRLGRAEFEAGFPTEEQLTDGYGVSRQTVREALRRLAGAGLLTRQRGRGTSVTSGGALEQPIGTFYSLAQTITESGATERSELIERGFHTNSEAAERLGLNANERLLHFVRLRFAGAEALALDDMWLAGEIGELVANARFEQGSLYAFLAESGVRMTGARERITAAQADARTSALLGVEPTAALLAIDRVTYSGERAVEWRRSLVRGDRFAFVAERTQPGA